jgi:hypothetical protein
MSRWCLLFYQCNMQKEDFACTLRLSLPFKLSSLLPVRSEKKKTNPALLFDSLCRLCPDVVFSSIGASLSF